MQVPETLTDLELEQTAVTNGSTASFTIERANIAAYGHFRDTEVEALTPGVNLFFGRNEAGKTTLFSFFYSMLFGIYPTAPDRHPYYPRESRHLHGEMWYRCGGRNVWVERKLMSSATGKMEIDGRPQNLGQRSLPEVDFLSKEVFASVFALDLDDLVAPARSKAWNDIQDRLLGGMNMDFLRSGRIVAKELEEDAGRIWRPDGRGKPLAKALEKDLAALKSQIRDARKRNDEIRSLVDEIEKRRMRHEELQAREAEVSRRLARMRRLLPASIALKRLRELQTQASDVGRYASLPADPIEELERLADGIEELDADIRKRNTAVEQCIIVRNEVTDADRSLVDQSAAIREWGRISGQVDSWRKRLGDIEQDIERATERRDADAARIFSDGWSDELAPLLAAVSVADLRAAIDAFTRAKKDADDARERDERRKERNPVRETAPWGIGVLATTLLATAAAAIGQYFAAIVVGLGVVAFGVKYLEARRHNERMQKETTDDPVAELDRTAEARRKSIVQVVDRLPLPGWRMETPDPQLASDIESMQRLAEDVARHLKPLQDLRLRLGAAETELKDFAAELGIGFTGFESTIDALLDNLREAEDRVRNAKDAESKQGELAVELVALQEKHERLTQDRSRLIAALEEIGGSAAEGAAVLADRRNAARLADRDQKDLRQAYGSIEDIDAEVRHAMETDPAMFADGSEELLEAERDRLSAAREAEAVALTECQKDLEELEKQPLLHELESEEESLQEKLDANRQERDRLTVLARIVREADERFRRRHQPDVIRRASVYFNSLTGGRYKGMMLEDEKLSLLPSNGSGIEIDEEHNWTSRGTRDQIFLSIRLALIDHLDAHHARLPVFLDEVFVNWDRKRRKAGLELLRRIAEQRQVFLFTCHEWFRDEVSEHLPANIITLD